MPLHWNTNCFCRPQNRKPVNSTKETKKSENFTSSLMMPGKKVMKNQKSPSARNSKSAARNSKSFAMNQLLPGKKGHQGNKNPGKMGAERLYENYDRDSSVWFQNKYPIFYRKINQFLFWYDFSSKLFQSVHLFFGHWSKTNLIK